MQIAEEFGIDYHNINPFHSGRSTNPYKLGLSGEKAKEIMPKLRPFQEIFSELKAKKKNIYLYGVCVDDGTERRIENFIERANPDLSPEEFYALIAYLHKSRINYGELTSKFKPFSQITPDNIDPEGIYIIIDDMFASGGTGFNAGRIFKECGAQRVECWTSHAVTMSPQYNKANQRDYVDFVRCLDTVPQSPKLEITQMKASAYLLSAELYKSHEKLVASR